MNSAAMCGLNERGPTIKNGAVMSETSLLQFALASAVLIALPGPDQALITRNALIGGRTAGRRTMLGGVCGLTVHATAAALGISALLAASGTAYSTLKIIGIAYLAYLGLRMITTAGTASRELDERHRAPRRRPFVQGLLCNALNPKVALFFLTFLPPFLPAHGATLPSALALFAIFATLYFVWFSALIHLIERIATVLRQPRTQARIERITGSALLVFAIRLAASAKP
jgi:threonine/homoserine/homoserine lactone efflux protein